MFFRTLALSCIAALVASQGFRGPSSGGFIPCGFVCTRNAAFTIFIDGINSSVRCSDTNGDLNARCDSCCQSYAMWGGLTSTAAAGFPSSDGNSCVCCVTNNRCGGGGGGPIAAAVAPNNNNNDF